jgi:hypothetical protein
MKRLLKTVLVAIPVLMFAATVGLTTMGCDDETTTPPVLDLSVVPTQDAGHDMAHPG